MKKRHVKILKFQILTYGLFVANVVATVSNDPSPSLRLSNRWSPYSHKRFGQSKYAFQMFYKSLYSIVINLQDSPVVCNVLLKSFVPIKALSIMGLLFASTLVGLRQFLRKGNFLKAILLPPNSFSRTVSGYYQKNNRFKLTFIKLYSDKKIFSEFTKLFYSLNKRYYSTYYSYINYIN